MPSSSTSSSLFFRKSPSLTRYVLPVSYSSYPVPDDQRQIYWDAECQILYLQPRSYFYPDSPPVVTLYRIRSRNCNRLWKELALTSPLYLEGILHLPSTSTNFPLSLVRYLWNQISDFISVPSQHHKHRLTHSEPEYPCHGQQNPPISSPGYPQCLHLSSKPTNVPA